MTENERPSRDGSARRAEQDHNLYTRENSFFNQRKRSEIIGDLETREAEVQRKKANRTAMRERRDTLKAAVETFEKHGGTADREWAYEQMRGGMDEIEWATQLVAGENVLMAQMNPVDWLQFLEENPELVRKLTGRGVPWGKEKRAALQRNEKLLAYAFVWQTTRLNPERLRYTLVAPKALAEQGIKANRLALRLSQTMPLGDAIRVLNYLRYREGFQQAGKTGDPDLVGLAQSVGLRVPEGMHPNNYVNQLTREPIAVLAQRAKAVEPSQAPSLDKAETLVQSEVRPEAPVSAPPLDQPEATASSPPVSEPQSEPEPIKAAPKPQTSMAPKKFRPEGVAIASRPIQPGRVEARLKAIEGMTEEEVRGEFVRIVGIPYNPEIPIETAREWLIRVAQLPDGLGPKRHRDIHYLMKKSPEYIRYAREAAESSGSRIGDSAILLAIAEIESGFNQNAFNPSGAAGPMQIKPIAAFDLIQRDPNLDTIVPETLRADVQTIQATRGKVWTPEGLNAEQRAALTRLQDLPYDPKVAFHMGEWYLSNFVCKALRVDHIDFENTPDAYLLYNRGPRRGQQILRYIAERTAGQTHEQAMGGVRNAFPQNKFTLSEQAIRNAYDRYHGDVGGHVKVMAQMFRWQLDYYETLQKKVIDGNDAISQAEQPSDNNSIALN